MNWLFLALLVLTPAPSMAQDLCDDLWFTRNLMFDRAGYCFGSALGRSIFDNADCTPGTVTLTPKAQSIVNLAKDIEAEFGCRIDSSRTRLRIPSLEMRKSLIDPPVPSGYESACLGWRGNRVPMRSERHVDGLVIGAIRKGDTLLFQYESLGDWAFVEVQQNDAITGRGWAIVDYAESACDGWAG